MIPAPIILQNCLATGDPTYCNLIERTSGGSISGSSLATLGGIVPNRHKYRCSGSFGSRRAGELPAAAGEYGFALVPVFRFVFAEIDDNAAARCAYLRLRGPVWPNMRDRQSPLAPQSAHDMGDAPGTWKCLLFGASSEAYRSTAIPQIRHCLRERTDAFDARMPNMSYLDLSASWKVVKTSNCGPASTTFSTGIRRSYPRTSWEAAPRTLFRPTISSDVSCTRRLRRGSDEAVAEGGA